MYVQYMVEGCGSCETCTYMQYMVEGCGSCETCTCSTWWKVVGAVRHVRTVHGGRLWEL